MKLAVIPARGGSKRIPRKNIKDFCGKPMIAWSIEAAIAGQCFDKIIVSTDDNEIADVARKWGAEVPFVRPRELADDFTGIVPVVAHAIKQLTASDHEPEYTCCIFATAPFVSAEDIANGFDTLRKKKDADYCFAVTNYAFPIQRAIRITSQKRVQMLHPEEYETRSQDLEEAYHDAGQFYWGKTSAWLSEKPMFSDDSIPIVLPRHRVQDIDTPEDWRRAELMFKALHH
ncbi:MAG: pseudaminic acid cytidylyltransferase [bacterium]|nr:pseudaminic acid cytidylyltransferase [Gammaproteobacteria bacterium]